MTTQNLKSTSKLVAFFSRGMWPLILFCAILGISAYVLNLILTMFGLGLHH
jgi:hypothetical protein